MREGVEKMSIYVFKPPVNWPDYLFKIIVHRHYHAVVSANRIIGTQWGFVEHNGSWSR